VLDLFWSLRRGQTSDHGIPFSLTELLETDPILLKKLKRMDQEYLAFQAKKREEERSSGN